MAHRATSRGRRRRPAGFGAALAGFALLCGVVLLLGQGGSCSATPPPQSHAQARAQLQAALGKLAAAEQAVNKQNFGELKATLRGLRTALQGALSELTPAKEQTPSFP